MSTSPNTVIMLQFTLDEFEKVVESAAKRICEDMINKEERKPYPYITKEQAAIELNTSVRNIRNLVTNGKVSKIDGKRYYLHKLDNGKFEYGKVLEFRNSVYGE